MAKKLTRLTSEEFDELVSNSRAEDATHTMARAVLVDGRGYAEVGHEHGIERQLVYQAVQRLLKVGDTAPATYTYTGPPEMFAEIDAVVEDHRGRKLLTAEQFDDALSQSGQGEQMAAISRAVLVDGVPPITLAREHGIARHLVWQAAQKTIMQKFDAATASTRVYKGSPAMFEAIDAIVAAYQKGKAGADGTPAKPPKKVRRKASGS